MKKLFALVAFLAFQAFGITNVTLPYLVDTASIPKVKYVDKNDSALKWGVNNLGDTLNAATGSGTLVRKASPTLTGTIAAANQTLSGTLGVTGIQTNSAAFTFNGTGSGADWSLWRSAGGGMVMRGGAGSSYDLSLMTPAASYILRNPTGTTAVELPGSGVTVAGTLGVTGVATFTTNPIMPFTANKIPYSNTDGSGSLTSTANLTYTSGTTTFATANGTFSGTLGVTGNQTNTALAGTGTRLVTATSTGILGNSAVIAGDNEWTGNAAFDGYIGFGGFGTGAAGRIYRTSVGGTVIWGAAGSSYDFLLANSAGSTVATIPTGTATVNFSGAVGVTGAITASNLTASSAVATDASKNLVSVTNTGTGNNVLSASPTLTGTIAAASQTLSGTLGVTGSSTLTGSVGIGTAPQTSDELTVRGSSTIGTQQYGLNVNPTFSTAATTAGAAGLFKFTNSGTFTMGSGYGLEIASPTLGTSTVTNVVGLDISNQTGGTNNYAIRTGTGLVSFGGNVSTTGTLAASTIALGGNEAFNYDEGSFTVTATGMTTSPTGTAYFTRVGQSVTLCFPAITATSNSTSFTYTGLPAAIQPARDQYFSIPQASDNSGGTGATLVSVRVMGTGSLSFLLNYDWTGWTASNLKGIPAPMTITYTLQ